MPYFPAQLRVFPALRALLLACVLAPLCTGELAAQKEDTAPPNPPPLALGTTVDVQRGGSVDIPLNSQGKYGETVNFLLRTYPKFGTLDTPRRVDRTSGSIHYRHGGGADNIEDSFTFATQTSNTPVSAPAKITIRIIDPPPALTAASRLNFGPVPVGETQKKVLKLTNSGGLPLSSKLDAVPPFSFEAGFDPHYTLQGGQTLEVPILFKPTAPGESSSVLKLGEGRSELTLLHGEATAPFSLAPDRLNLRNTPRDLSAPVTISNLTASSITVKLKWPWGFSGVEEITVPGNDRKEVFVQVSGNEPAEFEGKLKASLGSLTLETGLRALGLPGKLEAPAEVDFGLVGDPATGMKRITVKNTGGGPLMLEVRRDGDFVAPDLKEVLPLEAGEQTDLSIYPPQTAKGKWAGRLHLQQAGQEEHIIQFKGEIGSSPDRVTATPRTVAGTRVPGDTGTAYLTENTGATPEPAKPHSPGPTLAEIAARHEKEFDGNLAKFVYAIKDDTGIKAVRVIASGTNTVTISWPKSALASTEIGVQSLSVIHDPNGNIVREWELAQTGSVDRGIETDMVRATGLEPAHSYIFRLVHLTPSHSGSTELQPLSLPFPAHTSKPPPPFYAKPVFRNLGLTFLLMAVAAGYVWFRVFRNRA